MAVKRIATLIALAAGGWLLARKLRSWDEYDQQLPESPPDDQPLPESPPAAPIPGVREPIASDVAAPPEPAAPIAGGFGSDESVAPASASKAELYEQAKRLGIEGRSKMSRDELAEAVIRARHG